uniref:Uncharacterized protein n=1 Tax=Trichogramma kaykai TaxID=54128 RepID=A0ABD2VW00_9HYME
MTRLMTSYGSLPSNPPQPVSNWNSMIKVGVGRGVYATVITSRKTLSKRCIVDVLTGVNWVLALKSDFYKSVKYLER